jgi:hypothetical protein
MHRKKLFSFTVLEWSIGIAAALLGNLLVFGGYALAMAAGETDDHPSQVYTGEIPGYHAIVAVFDPTPTMAGTWAVRLCPPEDPFECKNGISGAKDPSWTEDQWILALNLGRRATEEEVFTALDRLNEAVRTLLPEQVREAARRQGSI